MRQRVRIEPVFEDGNFYVREDIRHDLVTVESYRAGPFDTLFEAECYAEQRYHWFLDDVRPALKKKRKPAPFCFIFPPP